MIIGIGNDICDIRRVERTLERFGDRFITRVFTDIEQRKAARRNKAGMKVIAGTYAKRFAAKEACSKALGTGFNVGVFMKDIGVVNQLGGKPTLQLEGGAHARLLALTPDGLTPVIHLTMTDEYPYAEAQVIIEAI